MGKKRVNFIYTDGGDFNSAIVIVKNNELMGTAVVKNEMKRSNEDTEAEAINNACHYAVENPDNWTIITDSRAVLDKIQNKVPNATRNPDIEGIQKMLKTVKESPLPQSLEIVWRKRLSDEWAVKADQLASHS